jgi:hypothetical protein
MQFIKALFSDDSYKDKIRSVTNLRVITFFIWKFLIGFILFWIFSKTTQNYYFSNYILNDLKFHFYISGYLKIFFIFSSIDYLKVLLFQNSEDSVSRLELITKIFLEPKYQTFFLFANSVLILLQMKVFYQGMNKPVKKKNTEMIDTIILVYG